MSKSIWPWLVRALLPDRSWHRAGCATWGMQITLRGDAETNSGRPLTVLVRSLPLPQYRSESYSDVSQLSLQPDQSVVRALTLEPREHFTRRLRVRVPSKTPVAIYFCNTSQAAAGR